MTDPIRPDDRQSAPEEVIPTPETPLPDGGPIPPATDLEVPDVAVGEPAAPAGAVEEPVADPELAALVAADTADAAAPVVEPVVEPPAAPVAEPAAVPAAPVPVVASVMAPPPAAPPVPAAVPVPAPVAAPPPAVAAPPRRSVLSIIRRVVAFLFGLLQALLILRIVLLLLNANQDNEIVAAIIDVTQPFIEPFMGIFQLDSVTGQNGSVLDIAAIVALVAWTLIETLILSILGLFGRRRR